MIGRLLAAIIAALEAGKPPPRPGLPFASFTYWPDDENGSDDVDRPGRNVSHPTRRNV